MKIKLNTRVIPSSTEMYALFPGQGYKHRPTMIDKSIVFLDFPDIKLPNKKSSFLKHKFFDRVAKSEALKLWISRGRQKDSKPSFRLKDYEKSRRGPKIKRNVNALEGLVHTAAKGDLILLPAPGHFGDLYIGELLDDVGTVTKATVGDATELYPGRKVRWIAKTPQHKFSEDFLKSIRTANPLVMVGRSWRTAIYDIAYESYVLNDRVAATFDVASPSYTSIDEYQFQKVVNYVSSLQEAIVEGDEKVFKLSINDAILSLQNPSFIPDLKLNINSPGTISLLSGKLVPLVTAAIFSLAISACSPTGSPIDYTGANSVKVVIELSDDIAGDCTAEVNEAVRDSLSIMGYDRWKELCQAVGHLNTKADMTPPGTVP